jgi:hypothetical protein
LKGQTETAVAELKPHTSCAVCGNALDEAQDERRIISQPERGISLLEEPDCRWDAGHSFCCALEISYRPPLYVTVWGDSQAWSWELLCRSQAIAAFGYRPWYCQRCADRVCEVCGKPFKIVMDCDVVHADGSLGFQPIMNYQIWCLNQDCLGYRPSSGGRWSLR